MLNTNRSMIAPRGFTLIELLIVIGIALLVSVLVIPTISSGLSHRQVSEAARIVQASLVGARDAAIRDNTPSGIRLVQDPLFSGQHGKFLADGVTPDPLAGQMDPSLILAYNRIIPIAPAPSYSSGLVTPLATMPLAVAGIAYTGPGTPSIVNPTWANTTALVITETPTSVVTGTNGQPTITLNEPTSWMWNVRVGDKIQINNSGRWYTIAGPMVIPPQGIMINNVLMANPEMFVNIGVPGTVPALLDVQGNPSDFLLLVNGTDDNINGWVDEGWDGVDNDNQNGIDDIGEWVEKETFATTLPPDPLPYTIQRRPVPQINAREIQLPSGVVIDATTWASTQERSRLPINQFTGQVDLLINPDGSVVPTTLYSSPSSIGMAGAFYHFWLSERSDLQAATGTMAPMLPIGTIEPQLVEVGTNVVSNIATATYSGPVVKGNMFLLSLSSRSGRVASREPGFDDPAGPLAGAGHYSASMPFLINMQSQQ
jgi:prepilin-type N-terminal cleavage/methylation domain-containing protein